MAALTRAMQFLKIGSTMSPASRRRLTMYFHPFKDSNSCSIIIITTILMIKIIITMTTLSSS